MPVRRLHAETTFYCLRLASLRFHYDDGDIATYFGCWLQFTGCFHAQALRNIHIIWSLAAGMLPLSCERSRIRQNDMHMAAFQLDNTR